MVILYWGSVTNEFFRHLLHIIINKLEEDTEGNVIKIADNKKPCRM